MNVDDGLEFLKNHQPLPPTLLLSETLIHTFDEIRIFFSKNLDERCVSLLLNSFGEGDGYGVYQLVEDTILKYPDDVVVTALVKGLRNPAGSVRYWCAQIAVNYRREELKEPLIELLRQGNVDEQIAAVMALEVLESSDAHLAMMDLLSSDIKDEVRNLILKILCK